MLLNRGIFILMLNNFAKRVPPLQPTATIDADVTNPGRYTFLVHYFQPNHVGFTVYVNVTIADQIYRGNEIL